MTFITYRKRGFHAGFRAIAFENFLALDPHLNPPPEYGSTRSRRSQGEGNRRWIYVAKTIALMPGCFAKCAMLMLLAFLLFGGQTAAAQTPNPAGSDVTVTEDAANFTLSNGTVTARVAKRTGVITSLLYKGTETLYTASGSVGAYWSQDATGGTSTVTRITIDPKSNHGDRAEVSVKAIHRGHLV